MLDTCNFQYFNFWNLTFLTKHKYSNIDTPKIEAVSWEDAEKTASQYDLEIIGEFIMDVEFCYN